MKSEAGELGDQVVFGVQNKFGVGLTKREYFAGLAMQSLVQWYNSMPSDKGYEIAEVAIQCADALLEKLCE